MDRTTEYAKLIVSGKKICGRKEMLACKRHLDDMDRKNFEYIFDVEMAERAINIANTLVIAEGGEPTPLKTRGFQNFIIGSLHGWRKKRSKVLRYREAYIQIARQNGKSFLSGIEGVHWSSFHKYNLGRIFCAATKQEQANIVWDEIAKFIRADENLTKMYKVKEHNREITSKVTGTVIKSVSRDYKSMDGFRSVLGIIDEYHAHPNNQTYSLIKDGQANVDTALTLAITTAGFNIEGPCHQQYKMCEKILEGALEKDSLFIFITELDKGDDIWDYRNWAKANPLLLWNEDDTINKEKVKVMAEKAIDAKEKGGEDLLNFLTKSLNQWVTYSGDSLVDLDAFAQCGSELKIDDMKGKECYLGIDLSKGGDLTSIALIFPLEQEKAYIYSHSFMPELRLAEHEQTDDVPYRIWVKQGLLTLTTGGSGIKTDYKFIVKHIEELIEKYDLKIIECGYDNHNAGAFISDLDFLGCDLTEIIQSARSLNDSTVDFRLTVKAKEIFYDKNNDLLKWSISNAITTKNSFDEIKINKSTQTNRIDPVDAIIDAWKLYFHNKQVSVRNANDDFDDWFEMMKNYKKEQD